MSETEQKRLRDIEVGISELFNEFVLKAEVDGEPIEAGAEIFVGKMLSVFDVLFSIRDGEEWRGMSDPQTIARKVLQDIELGDEE